MNGFNTDIFYHLAYSYYHDRHKCGISQLRWSNDELFSKHQLVWCKMTTNKQKRSPACLLSVVQGYFLSKGLGKFAKVHGWILRHTHKFGMTMRFTTSEHKIRLLVKRLFKRGNFVKLA